MNKYPKIAKSLGFTEAVYLPNIALESKEEIRKYCNPKQCPNHGQNWVCPPACGTLDECHEKTKEFTKGIVLQSMTKLTPPTSMEMYKSLNIEHNLRFKKFIEEVRKDVTQVLPLTTGGCIFCDSCSFPNPCIKPEVKMESLSAFGIDVSDLCLITRLPYSFREDRVYFIALLLTK